MARFGCDVDKSQGGEFIGAGWHQRGVVQTFQCLRGAEDRSECLDSLGYDDELSQDEENIRLLYSRLVDTHECLVAHGYEELPEPQDEEIFVEVSLRAAQDDGAQSERWNPYFHESFYDLSQDELEEIEKQCPAPWFGVQ
ncbi:MAG TPA: hypothetical protein VK095_03895, partial [Beutenbergiaceae bacterium]|nr:hypothetical protein [Beutenbergiaceae bacterium]